MTDEARFAERLDPELVEFIKTKPPVDLSDIAAARAGYNARMAEIARSAAPSKTVETTAIDIPREASTPPVSVLLHRPRGSSATAPALLWVHGGGHVMGVAVQDEPMLLDLVERVGCVVVAVEWRYAPEDPYPASIDDCWTALTWMASNAEKLGIDASRIVVAGASSGGGVAAGLTLLCRDRGGPAIAAQVLIYPMLDDRELTHSSHIFTDTRVWNAESNRVGWNAYLGDLDRSNVPIYAAPGRATELAGLPSTWIGALELDPLVDDAVDYAQALMKAGVSTELHVLPGAIHAVESGLPDSAIALRFVAERDAALDRFLAP